MAACQRAAVGRRLGPRAGVWRVGTEAWVNEATRLVLRSDAESRGGDPGYRTGVQGVCSVWLFGCSFFRSIRQGRKGETEAGAQDFEIFVVCIKVVHLFRPGGGWNADTSSLPSLPSQAPAPAGGGGKGTVCVWTERVCGGGQGKGRGGKGGFVSSRAGQVGGVKGIDLVVRGIDGSETRCIRGKNPMPTQELYLDRY